MKKTIIMTIFIIVGSCFLIGCGKTKTHEVTFNSEEGVLISGELVQQVKHGEDAVAPVFEKEGYTLSWDKDFSNVKNDLNIKAIWVLQTFNVVFNSNGGVLVSGSESQEVLYNKAAIAPIYEKEGYTLSWDKDFSNVKTDLIINAVWTTKLIEVKFNGEGGVLISGDLIQQVSFGNSAIAPVFEKEGYILSWDKDFSNVKSDLVVNAIWTVKTFDVKFNGEDGILIKGDTVQQVAYGNSAKAPIFEKEGYTLSWDKDFSNVKSDLVINAIWTVKTFEVKFNGEGGVLISGDVIQQVAYGNSALAPLFDKEGYTLSWDKDFSNVKSDLVINAIWTVKTFEVKFNGEGGVLISGDIVQQVAYGNSALAPLFEKEGYTLSWDKDFSCIKEDMVVNACWEASKYIVTFNGNGGTLIEGLEQQTIDHGEQIIDIPKYINSGYSLIGWYSEGKLFDFDSLITEDINLIAQWELVYKRVNKQNIPDENGEYLLFGYYPQSIKASNVTVSNSGHGWLFVGSDGANYKKVIANPLANNYTFSDGTDISGGGIYYFKIEPIRWRILSFEDGVLFIICDSIIDSQIFNEFYVGPNEYGAYPNNYAYSFIRNWLNNDFYIDAFSASQKSFILTTEVDNSELSTGDYPNRYASDNTFDKIFLLSYLEATNYSYGFSYPNSNCSNRQMLTSDYSRAVGAYMNVVPQYFGYGLWHFRSPSLVGNYYVKNAYYHGYVGEYRPTEDEGPGVVPALKLMLQ